jgi:hypothetical protein
VSFALLGIVSEPASPAHISVGKLVDDCALITSATGGRELYPERTIQPFRMLLTDQWPATSMNMSRISEDKWERFSLLERTNILAVVAELLPTLIASAYSAASRHQPGEALINSWFASEQMLDRLWREYVSSLREAKRQERLRDTRTYSAAVRIETLHTVGRIDSTVYDALHTARKYRNDLAHRAKIDTPAAEAGLNAMKLMIELLCKTSVEPPQLASAINW